MTRDLLDADLREMAADPGPVPIAGSQWDAPTAEQRQLAGLAPLPPAPPIPAEWKSRLDAADHGSSSTST